MNTETNKETIAEIVGEMRERCIDEEHSPCLWPYIDRIESAHKREVAKLKSALLDFYKNTCVHCDLYDACQEGEDGMSVPCNMILKAKATLEASGENVSETDDWTAIDTVEETMSNQKERC